MKKKTNIIVLGSGLVGAPMCIDLARESDFDVTAVDIDRASFKNLEERNPSIRTTQADLSEEETVRELVKPFDYVISAVPGHMGYQTLKAVIESKKNVVDISFFPEDPFLLDAAARNNHVKAVVDCGVAPGMSNILVGHVHRLLDETLKVLIYVGGLPEVREWPYEFKAGFSPIDVIEEYVRPARYIANGRLVVKPALSEPELVHFPEVGTLEAFNTDGLRTLATTIAAPDMKEKTLRYPGHIEKMAMLRETGFFDKTEMTVNGATIRPLDLTARLLFPKWKLDRNDRDLTVMRIVVEGKKAEKRLRHTYELLDRHDPSTETHSMARTTGYTATVALRMLARGLYDLKGISPPEFIGRRPECYRFMLNGLEDRGVFYRETVEDCSVRLSD
ncbi:MAG: saccharopine dehydrogenase NADP-binding domain-containing protein [Candidatus Aminicenantes bacterium]|nr:saccharopine dehydrogenase NADP-binding domain-containing protein [Candidatus Aminicenantes bacterium]